METGQTALCGRSYRVRMVGTSIENIFCSIHGTRDSEGQAGAGGALPDGVQGGQLVFLTPIAPMNLTPTQE